MTATSKPGRRAAARTVSTISARQVMEERDVSVQVLALRREVRRPEVVEDLLGRLVEGEGQDERLGRHGPVRRWARNPGTHRCREGLVYPEDRGDASPPQATGDGRPAGGRGAWRWTDGRSW